MQIRKVLALTAMMAVPAFTAGAQFTTVVAPPPAQKQAVAVAAAAKAAPSDTGHRATLREMSAWVDSVAGAPAPSVTVDSAAGDVALSDSATAPVSSSEANAGTTKFADGARAPNTASPLPIILVAGLGALLVGAWLLVTGRRPDPAVARPRRGAR